MSQGFNNIKNIAKTGLKLSPLIPYLGDTVDVVEGLYQATHGHPILGGGQTALGIGGMAANFMFPGAGSVGKAAVKGAAKKAVTKAPSILEKFARWNRSGMGMAQSTALPNVGYLVYNALNLVTIHGSNRIWASMPAHKIGGRVK